MTDYNDGKWHGWNGGECPVHPMSEVEAVWHDPKINKAGMTGPRLAFEKNGARLAWSHVVKFRVVKPYREPREFWVNVYPDPCPPYLHKDKETADRQASRVRIECIRVREVLDD